LILGLVLCATAHDPSAWDLTTPVRCVIWSCVTLVLLLSVEDFRFPKRWIYLLFGGYVLTTSLTILWATNAGESLYWSHRVFMMFIYFCLATMIFKEVPIKTMAFIGACLAAYGVGDTVAWMIDPEGGTTAMEVTGLMSNRNLWCAAQLLFLPFCIFAYKEFKYVSVTGTMCILFNLFVLFARSSFLALIVSVGVISLFCKRLRWAVILGVVALVFICSVKMTAIKETDSLRQRFELWPQTVKMIAEHPLGVGAGNWRIDIQRYANNIDIDEAFTRIFYQRPHNDFLWVISEIGWLGGSFYLSLFVMAMYYAVKSKNYPVIMGLVAYMTLAFFTFPRERAFHSMMLVLYLAFSVIHYKGKLVKINLRPVIVLISFVLLFGVVVFSCRLIQDRRMKIIRRTNDTNIIVDVTDKYIPFCTLDLTSMPVAWYRGFAYRRKGNFREAKKNFVEAEKANPYHTGVLNDVAMCYSTEGDLPNAIETLSRLQKIRQSSEVARHLKSLNDKKISNTKTEKTR